MQEFYFILFYCKWASGLSRVQTSSVSSYHARVWLVMSLGCITAWQTQRQKCPRQYPPSVTGAHRLISYLRPQLNSPHLSPVDRARRGGSSADSGDARNFHLGGYIAHGVWGEEVPSGFRGEATVRSLGTKSPRSWSSLQTLYTDFDCRND